jgi:hypothetical protein
LANSGVNNVSISVIEFRTEFSKPSVTTTLRHASVMPLDEVERSFGKRMGVRKI